jgi:hypothetical protein
MYDPNQQPSVERGVRICDLPCTGPAALSRRREIGDELLSVNAKSMARLTFDEIMDFIMEADPEQVNLLSPRPRKAVLAAGRNVIRHGAFAAVAALGPGPNSMSAPTSVNQVTQFGHCITVKKPLSVVRRTIDLVLNSRSPNVNRPPPTAPSFRPCRSLLQTISPS